MTVGKPAYTSMSDIELNPPVSIRVLSVAETRDTLCPCERPTPRSESASSSFCATDGRRSGSPTRASWRTGQSWGCRNRRPRGLPESKALPLSLGASLGSLGSLGLGDLEAVENQTIGAQRCLRFAALGLAGQKLRASCISIQRPTLAILAKSPTRNRPSRIDEKNTVCINFPVNAVSSMSGGCK